MYFDSGDQVKTYSNEKDEEPIGFFMKCDYFTIVI